MVGDSTISQRALEILTYVTAGVGDGDTTLEIGRGISDNVVDFMSRGGGRPETLHVRRRSWLGANDAWVGDKHGDQCNSLNIASVRGVGKAQTKPL